MEEELEVLWAKCEESIKMKIRCNMIELMRLGVKPKISGAFCVEGGWMIGDHEFNADRVGFDIRAFGWSTSHGKNWYKYVRFGTEFHLGKMPIPNIERIQEIANEMVKDTQNTWDEGIKNL